MKKIFGFIVTFFVLSFIAVFISENALKNHEKEILSQEKELLQTTYNTIIKAYKTHAEIFFLSKINTKEVIDLMRIAWHENDKRVQTRQNLYDLLSPSYKSIESYKIKQLHFHLPNSESFLRFHRPNIFGDNLKGIRESIEWVNQNKKPFLGFEEGKIYNGYRFVFPILDGENHYGSVEVSVSIKEIINQMKEELGLRANFIIKKDLVRKKVFDFEQDNYTDSKINSQYLYEKELLAGDEKIIESISSHYKNLSKELSSSNIFSFSTHYNNSMFITTYLPLINELTKERVAYIITTRQSKELSYLYNKNSIIRVVIILLLGMLIFSFYKIQKDNEEIKNKNRVLNDVQQIAKLGSWEYIASTEEVKWSDEVFTILGLAPNYIKPSYTTFLSYAHKDDVEKLKESFESSIASKSMYEMHHRIIKSDGSLAYVDERGYHIYDEHGDHIKSFGTIHDVTHIVEYENQINKIKSELVSIANNINDVLFKCKIDDKRTPIYLNNAIYTISGYSLDDFLNSEKFSYMDIIYPDDRDFVKTEITKAINNSLTYIVEYRIINSSGNILWVRESGRKGINDEGNEIIEGVITDITHQKESIQKLQKFINAQDTIIVLTNNDKLLFANKKFFDFFGYKDLNDFYKHYKCICQMFIKNDNFFHMEKIKDKKSWIEELHNLNSKDRVVSMLEGSTPYAFALSINNYENDIYIITFTDISDTFVEKLELQEKITHDHLTKAYNRAYFDSMIKTYLNHATLEHKYIGLILFDIDYFKNINDTYGHDKGDYILTALANLVKHSIRSDDKLIRWGGEEFIIICLTTSIQDTAIQANHIRSIIENYTFDIPQTITCSFGVSIIDNEDILQSIKKADKNLYEAKKAGRNRVYPIFNYI